jgi:hypothetical protein
LEIQFAAAALERGAGRETPGSLLSARTRRSLARRTRAERFLAPSGRALLQFRQENFPDFVGESPQP